MSSPDRRRLPFAQKAPWWPLFVFGFTTMIGLIWAVAFTFAIIQGTQVQRWVENEIINGVVWLAALAFTGLQATALAGVYTRRQWGRPVAMVAAAAWAWSVGAIPFIFLFWWAIYRRWDPGVAATLTRDHPPAPGYLVGLCAAGTGLLLAWIWFLYLYLPPLLESLTAGASTPVPASTWYTIVTVAFVLSLPLWVVQALALVGLLKKNDWGAVLATLASMLWVLSLVGLPFGVAGLFVLWRWQHPALGPHTPRAATLPA